MKIIVAHSPDSDDAFMHYALARNVFDTGDLEFDHVLKDIQTLNQCAEQGLYEVTAISTHAYAYVADKYALLPHGASMGENYGPMIVARENFSTDDIKKQIVAVPGLMTSAYLALKLFAPEIQTVVMPFDEILPAVERGEVAAGLLIHEGQLTYGEAGLHNIVDLGVWWADETGGLPLPLGGNAIRRDLGENILSYFAFSARKHSLCAGTPRRSPRIRAGICARHGNQAATCRPICRDVCQSAHTRLWRRWPQSSAIIFRSRF